MSRSRWCFCRSLPCSFTPWLRGLLLGGAPVCRPALALCGCHDTLRGILPFILASTGSSFFPEPEFPPLRVTAPRTTFDVPSRPYRPPASSFCRVLDGVSSRAAAIVNCDHSLPAVLRNERRTNGDYVSTMHDSGGGKRSMTPFYSDFSRITSTRSN